MRFDQGFHVNSHICYTSLSCLILLSPKRKPMAEAKMGAAPAAPAGAKAKTETMSTRQLAALLADKHEMSKKAANELMEDLTGLITKQLKKGVRIRLNG